MDRTMAQPHQGRAEIRHLLRWQGIMTAIMLLVAAPFGSASLLSAAVGGAACLLANLAAAFWVFRRYRAQQPGALVLRFYGAEIVKITLILTLFAIAYVAFESLILPIVLGSYLIVQTVPALIPDRSGDGSAQRRC
jgi:ATP synthase protein I